jgi:hypothetical protein
MCRDSVALTSQQRDEVFSHCYVFLTTFIGQCGKPSQKI